MNTTVRKQSSSERPCEARLCVQHSTSAPAFHSAQSHKKIIKMPPRRQQLHHVEWLITGRSKSHFVWRNAKMLMNNNDDVDLPLGKQLEPANGSEKRFLFIYADSKFGWAEDVHSVLNLKFHRFSICILMKWIETFLRTGAVQDFFSMQLLLFLFCSWLGGWVQLQLSKSFDSSAVRLLKRRIDWSEFARMQTQNELSHRRISTTLRNMRFLKIGITLHSQIPDSLIDDNRSSSSASTSAFLPASRSQAKTKTKEETVSGHHDRMLRALASNESP